MSHFKFRPKKINEQTILITGATNATGRFVALLGAERGARIVIASENEIELQILQEEITKKGGQVLLVVTDFTTREGMNELKEKIIANFGTVDTWINNAGSSIFGYLLDSDIEEERKLFETNFWGARIGSQIAVELMKKNGGVIINLGNEVSVSVQPLKGMYSASKSALKAFTNSLRSEIRDRNYPIEVCLLRPTPDESTDVTAEAILKCAENPQRDVYVGGPARLSSILDTFFPKVKDMMAESKMKELRKNFKSSLKDYRKEHSH